MKNTALIVVLLVPLLAQGQNWNEWFRQKKTQKKYLVEQIAALKIYAEYLNKGYQIANGGLNVISDVKNSEFSLHKDYFRGLKLVSPKVRGYARVAQVMQLNLDLVRRVAGIKSGLRKDVLVTGSELEYLDGVFGRLLTACKETLDELEIVMSDGVVAMSDDQRIKRIDVLYLAARQNEDFLDRFSRQAISLTAGRRQAQREVTTSSALYLLK